MQRHGDVVPPKNSIGNKAQNGSALVYILIAIALLAALTFIFTDSSSQQQTSQNSTKLAAELKNQIDFIRSALQECVISYPKGDTSMPAANPVGTNAGRYPIRPYPLRPNNDYLAVPTVGETRVSGIKCPGNPGNSNNHAPIFGGATGKFLPPPPAPLDAWRYYNDIDGVFLFISTDKADAYIENAMQKVDAQFAPCEAQFVKAGSLTHFTSNADAAYGCGNGFRCFAYRMITTGTTIYPGEAPGTCP